MVYSVLDVAPLRMTQRFISEVVAAGTWYPVPAGPTIPVMPVLPPHPGQGGSAASRTPRAASTMAAAAAAAAVAAAEASFGRLSEAFRTEEDGKSARARLIDLNGGVGGGDEDGGGGRDGDVGHGGEARDVGGNASSTSGGGKLVNVVGPFRRKPLPNVVIPYYIRIPRGVVVASRALAHVVNPYLLPQVPVTRADHLRDLAWLPSEDQLLATGILNYGGAPRLKAHHATR
jgi:hypothetical protein